MTGSSPTPQPPLAALLDQHSPDEGLKPTHLPALTLHRFSTPLRRSAMLYEPSLCMVAQGCKRAYLGDSVYEYNPMHYLVATLPLPVEAEFTSATPARPLLALVLRLDSARVARLILEIGDDSPSTAAGGPALFVSPISDELQTAVLRLVRIASEPTQARVLGAGALNEVMFHLILGEQGERLRDLALRDNASQRVARAVRYVDEHFAEPIAVATLAKVTGMSASTLHHAFRDVTTLSPIQYQKNVRLHRARLLMLSDDLNAGEAAFRVGYGSPSQFSREFKRLFGDSPAQAVKALKQQLTPPARAST